MNIKERISMSITNKLIFVNVIVFFVVWILKLIFGDITQFVALQPASIIHGQCLWTIVTSMFVHFSFWHLVVNMISFYFVGNFVEKIIGGRRVIYLYLLSGIFASLFWSFSSGFLGFGFFAKIFGDSTFYGIGASGAVFGFIGILAVLTPKTKIYMIVGPIVAIVLEYIFLSILPEGSVIETIISVAVSIYFLIAALTMIGPREDLKKISLPVKLNMWLLPFVSTIPLIIVGIFVDLPIGNMAHVGGLLFGLFYGFILKKKYPNRTKLISKRFQN